MWDLMIDAWRYDVQKGTQLIHNWSISKKIQYQEMSIDFSKNDLLAA